MDPDTRQNFENDVFAVLGMHVLIFEEKSGKLAAAARRGGLDSLKKNFIKLFVEPGEQATRLEALLARRLPSFELLDYKGAVVRVDPSGPSVVHKFGVCLEQFASVTSSRRLFRELGLLGSDQAWTPILTVAELRMISDRLDSELSFLHYLTRHATIDDSLDFVASGWGAMASMPALRLSFRASGVRPFGRFTPLEHGPASRAAGYRIMPRIAGSGSGACL